MADGHCTYLTRENFATKQKSSSASFENNKIKLTRIFHNISYKSSYLYLLIYLLVCDLCKTNYAGKLRTNNHR